MSHMTNFVRAFACYCGSLGVRPRLEAVYSIALSNHTTWPRESYTLLFIEKDCSYPKNGSFSVMLACIYQVIAGQATMLFQPNVKAIAV